MTKFIYVLIFALIIQVFYGLYSFNNPRRTGDLHIAGKMTQSALKYHGVSSATREDGMYYFYRNGQRHRLFTNNFKKHFYAKQRLPKNLLLR